MTLLIVALVGVTDTLVLPKPASAIACFADSRMAYLAGTGEELYVQSSDEQWQDYPLPRRFSNVQRLLVNDDLCYILSDRTLILCDLRNNNLGVVAEGVDDAVLTRYGELWLLSDFSLLRVSPLGREIERLTLTRTVSSLWMLHDTLNLVDKDHPLPLSQACKDELQNTGTPLENLGRSPASLAVQDTLILLLIDSRHVLRVRCFE